MANMQDLQIHTDGKMTWTIPIRPSEDFDYSEAEARHQAYNLAAYEELLRAQRAEPWLSRAEKESVLDRILEAA